VDHLLHDNLRLEGIFDLKGHLFFKAHHHLALLLLMPQFGRYILICGL